jgi:hypothetical protein
VFAVFEDAGGGLQFFLFALAAFGQEDAKLLASSGTDGTGAGCGCRARRRIGLAVGGWRLR